MRDLCYLHGKKGVKKYSLCFSQIKSYLTSAYIATTEKVYCTLFSNIRLKSYDVEFNILCWSFKIKHSHTGLFLKETTGFILILCVFSLKYLFCRMSILFYDSAWQTNIILIYCEKSLRSFRENTHINVRFFMSEDVY